MQQLSLSQQPRSYLLSSISRLAGSLLPFASRQPLRLDVRVTTPPGIDPLSYSARKCAACRAVESQRSDALFHDPLAAVLAGPHAISLIQGYVRPRIAIRTRYFDEFAESAITGHSRVQLVSLGAGMETRVYRLQCITEAVHAFEVDSDVVLSLKETILAAEEQIPPVRAGTLVRVRGDVTAEWVEPLVEAGFDPSLRTVWLIEGLVYYLTYDQLDKLFNDVYRVSAPGSSFCFSAVTRLRSGTLGLASMFKSAIPNPKDFVEGHGFRFDACDKLGGENASYGRWPPNPDGTKDDGVTIYVSATKT